MSVKRHPLNQHYPFPHCLLFLCSLPVSLSQLIDRSDPYKRSKKIKLLGRTWVVLNIGVGGELSTGGESVGHHALEHDGLEVGTGKVDGSSMASGTRSNDDDLGVVRGVGNWRHGRERFEV